MKSADAARPRVSKTTTVRLDDLQPRVVAAAAAAGVGPSTWLRDLVRRELEAIAPTDVGAPAGDAGNSTAVYRAWLSADLTAQLDARRKRDGFRSRAAVLRALISGVGVVGGADASGVGNAGAGGAAPGKPVALREAVDALGASNHALVGVARSVSGIAKTLRGNGGVARVIDRIELEAAVGAIDAHVLAASQLLGDLRPMLKRAADQ